MKRIILSIYAIGMTGFAWAQQGWNSHPDSVSRGAFLEDTRAEAKSRWEYRDYMRATATAIEKSQISGNKIYSINLKKFLQQRYGNYPVDKSVRFADQPAAGFCTGFLIAPDILVTAGHCILNEEDMQKTAWLFDYTSDLPYNSQTGQMTVDPKNIYYGVELMATYLSQNSDDYDYCVIRLDRKTGRKPYKFRTGGKLQFEDMVTMIGSPSGLPLKVADSAHVTNNDYKTWFMTDLDAFQGNSGGPVFNQSGWIEGILVRGATGDFEFDATCNCIKQVVQYDFSYWLFGDKAEKGNIAHRITHIPADILKSSLYRNLQVSIDDFNMVEFKEWASYRWIFQEKLTGKENLLAYAAKTNRSSFVDTMLSIPGIDVNALDQNKSPLACVFAEYGLTSSIEKICSNKSFDTDLKNSWGETALMIAAKNGNSRAVKALLNAGANFAITNNAGKTARDLAKSNKQKETAKILKLAAKGKPIY